MSPWFAGQPVAAVLFGATALVWVINEARQALRRRANAANTDRYSLIVVRASIAVGVLLAFLSLRVRAVAYAFDPIIFGACLTLMWAGIGLRWWSFHTLGRYFTFSVMTSADQPVITAGPYRILRHPSYAGLLFTLAGLGLTFGNLLSLAALLALALIGIMYRIRVEETALASALGATYTTYATTRKRLIPFVW